MNFINSKPKIVQQLFWWTIAIGIPIPMLYSLHYIIKYTFTPIPLIMVILMIIIVGFAYYKILEDFLKEVTKGFKKIFKYIIDTGE